MKCSWLSRKGKSRTENRDAAGVVDSSVFFLGLIVDGGTKGLKGAVFVGQWIAEVLNNSMSVEELTADQLIVVMMNAQIAIRYEYPRETACYTALILRHDLQKAYAVTCGDCRLGIISNENSLEWLTPVHTVENFLSKPLAQQEVSLAARHTVTRCLNSRRFVMPEVLQLPYFTEREWVLATDGYWVGMKDEESEREASLDDNSCLRVGYCLEVENVSDSDSNNFSILHN